MVEAFEASDNLKRIVEEVKYVKRELREVGDPVSIPDAIQVVQAGFYQQIPLPQVQEIYSTLTADDESKEDNN